METIYSKGKNGWKAETRFSMGPARERHGEKMGERVLTISTGKNPFGKPGLQSHASGALHLDGWVQHVIGYGAPGGDYSARVEATAERCTEKNVRKLHARALQRVEEVLAAARAHYARQDAERAAKAAPKEEEREVHVPPMSGIVRA